MTLQIARALILVVLALGCGCSALGRKANQALPEFMRGDPGKEEKERIQQIQQRLDAPAGASVARTRAFENAKRLFTQCNFDAAASALEDFIDDFPGSEFDEEAKYLLGEAHYRANDYSDSFDAFKVYAESYPVSNRAPCIQERVYAMGCAYLSGRRKSFLGLLSNRGVGEEMFTWLVQTYPNARRAPDAQWALGRYYVNEKDWPKATTAFDYLAKQYPNSEWYAGARYFTAYTRYRQVKGTRYDPGIVREARSRFVSYVKDFPTGQWRADAERLICILDNIAAQYLLNVANWYVDQDKCWSARYYLEKLLSLYPNTNAAVCATQLLARLPVNPPCPSAERESVIRTYESGENPIPESRPEGEIVPAPESRP
jgi:outer membrane protein assembly factor BamD (BamD/ComL family)